jgi:hypothetical protein
MSKLVRISVVMALVPVVLVTRAGLASASAGEPVAADSATVGVSSFVGIAAVVFGFGGLVVGLLRHRRREAAVSVRQPVESRQSEHAA